MNALCNFLKYLINCKKTLSNKLLININQFNTKYAFYYWAQTMGIMFDIVAKEPSFRCFVKC